MKGQLAPIAIKIIFDVPQFHIVWHVYIYINVYGIVELIWY